MLDQADIESAARVGLQTREIRKISKKWLLVLGGSGLGGQD